VSRLLFIALAAMFFQQSFTVLSQSIIPLIAPAALPSLGAPPAYVGVYVSIAAVMKTIVNMGCGNFIRRYGGLRVSQAGLIFVLIGLLCAATGYIWAFLITAVCIALGTAAGTPASSHILHRYSPPKYAPVVFSAKQTAVPVGLAFGGLAIPFLASVLGWQGALIAIGILCALFALVLQPIRAELDRDRDPTQKLSLGDFKSILLLVLGHRGLRRLSITIFAFVGLQVTYQTYMVLFLTNGLDYSYVEAGGLFATAMAVAIPTRILWGYIASTWLGASNVLGGLAVTMALASAATGFYTTDWEAWQILGVAIVVTSTALGWQGVLLSEIARLAPVGYVGPATGGVLSFSSIGQVIMPLVFSGLLALTESYSHGFVVVAIPALLVGIMLFAGGVDGRAKGESHSRT
jgi:MFS family permease